jgi:hypothetical protein
MAVYGQAADLARTAMGTDQHPSFFELFQILSNGHFRYPQPNAEITDLHIPFPLQVFHNDFVPLSYVSHNNPLIKLVDVLSKIKTKVGPTTDRRMISSGNYVAIYFFCLSFCFEF